MSGRGAIPKQLSTPKARTPTNSATVCSNVSPKSGFQHPPHWPDATFGQKTTSRIQRRPSPVSRLANSSIAFNSTYIQRTRLVNTTLRKPSFKDNLTTSSTNDPQLEVDIAYGEYLQVLLKKEIVTKIINNYNQAIKDQLAIHHDLLHRKRQSHELMEKETTLMDSIQDLNIILNNLQAAVEEFSKLNVNYSLETMFQDTFEVLNSACDGLELKCVCGIQSQDEYVEVLKIISTCMISAEKLMELSEDLEGCSKLANYVNKLHNLIIALEKQQRENMALERSSAYAILQFASETLSTK